MLTIINKCQILLNMFQYILMDLKRETPSKKNLIKFLKSMYKLAHELKDEIELFNNNYESFLK